MADPIEISTAAGGNISFEVKQGMMAGNIADGLNQTASEYGLKAKAFNQIELFDIGDVSIQFELIGDNSEPVAVSASISDGDTSSLVSEINDFSDVTGILAFKSATGAVALKKIDGNDISVRDIVTSDGSALSVRQLDEFGEVINTEAVSSGEYIISGGQIKVISTDSFQVSSGLNIADNSNSEFLSSFVKKDHDLGSNSSDYEFKVLGSVDSNNLDAAGINAVAASSSYTFSLSTDNSLEENSVTIKPNSTGQLTSAAVGEALVSGLRSASPQTKLVGNEFEFIDGFPAEQSSIEFQLGNENYLAVLKTEASYEIDGTNVIIDGETLTQTEALERLVRTSSFDISGPEENRIYVGFEESGSGFRLFASAKDGILSGDGLRLSDNNSASQKSLFYLDNNVAGSTITTIMSGEFDLTQGAQLDFARIVSGSNEFNLDFDPAAVPKVSPANPVAGISVEIEDLGNNQGRLLINIDQSTTDLDVRLKANDNSASFGIVTSTAQLTLGEQGFKVSNHDNQRVTSSAEVSSLSNTVFNIEDLAGEDLLVYAKGNGKISLLGGSQVSTDEIDSREITARVTMDKNKSVELFDYASGDYLGTRELSDSTTFSEISIGNLMVT